MEDSLKKMDDLMPPTRNRFPIRMEGFAGQVMHVLPRPLLERERRRVLVRPLYVTDIGFFPRARGHLKERPAGAAEHILLLCVRGAGWVEVQGRREPVRAGQAVLIPRGVPHSYGASDRNPWTIHWMHFNGEDAAIYSRMLPEERRRVPVSASCRNEMVGAFRRCYACLERGTAGREVAFLSHAARHILGALFFQNQAYWPGRKGTPARDLQSVINLMASRLAGGLCLADMARAAGLSVVHFSALFRRQTGLPPVEYYIQLRIRHAGRLLDTTTITVREVGAEVGYDDPYYFSRIFRRVMGLSPRAYRALHGPRRSA